MESSCKRGESPHPTKPSNWWFTFACHSNLLLGCLGCRSAKKFTCLHKTQAVGPAGDTTQHPMVGESFAKTKKKTSSQPSRATSFHLGVQYIVARNWKLSAVRPNAARERLRPARPVPWAARSTCGRRGAVCRRRGPADCPPARPPPRGRGR